MTKQFFTIILFCTALSSYVFSQQKTSGVIYYDQVVDIKSMMAQAQQNRPEGGQNRPEGAGDGQVRVMAFGGSNMGGNMPEKITNKFEIVFNPNGAKFQKTIDEDAQSNPAGMMMMRFGGGDRDVFFTNSDKITESFEMSGEEFLLETQLGAQSKEVEKSEETRKIIGFDCKKAIVTGRNGSKTILWYTTDLAFKASPMAAFWTDGVVLAIENERMKYTATSIEYTKIKDSEITLPKNAKMITQEEYQKKMEEMRSRFRNMGGGQREIRIQQ